jgi:hypothetical protein
LLRSSPCSGTRSALLHASILRFVRRVGPPRMTMGSKESGTWIPRKLGPSRCPARPFRFPTERFWLPSQIGAHRCDFPGS